MTNDKITIRRWTVDDWQVFKAMRIEAVTHHANYFGTGREKALDAGDDYWKNTLTDAYNGAVFGLYDGDIAIGLTAAFRHKDHKENTIMLGMSYIREEYRGNGLSDLLYNARIGWAKEQEGISRIWVGHRANNDASHCANQRHGFALLSIEDMTFGDGITDKHYTYELKI